MAMEYAKSIRPSEPEAKYNSIKRDLNEETAPARNSAMVGKARNTNLGEKRKAMAKKKMQGSMR